MRACKGSQNHSEDACILGVYTESRTHNQKILAKEHVHNRQQHKDRDTYHCMGKDTREEGNLFGVASLALTAKNIVQKSFPYISWNSSPDSLYAVLF